MEYKLIWEMSSSMLSEKVTEHLKFGWRLYGNPSTTDNGYIQAVIIHNKFKPNDYMKLSYIEKEDVLNVAFYKSIILTDDQIKSIIEEYPSAQLNDPGATWDLVVDNLIDELEH